MKANRWAGMAAMITMAGMMTGCMSAYRLTSTLGLSGELPQTGGATFNIVSVDFVNPTNIPSSELPSFGDYFLDGTFGYNIEKQKQPDGKTATVLVPVPHHRHQALLMGEAQKRYPQLFSSEPGAIPVRVTITRAAYVSETPGNPCVTCITLSLVPMREQGRTDYTVQVASGDFTVDKLLEAPVSFSRLSHSSSSCFIPSGWLPVSGGKEKKLTGDVAMRVAGELTVNGCIEAVLLAIRRVEPAAWERLRPKPKAD